jgi:hypothetical protein
LRWPQFSRLAAYRSPPMLPRLTAADMAADTAADMAAVTLAADMVAVTLAAVTLVAVTLVADTLADTLRADISGPGTDPAHGSWLGVDPHTSGLHFTGAHSACVDTAGISGMAIGGTTALARAGYGRTITASTCGPATKILEHDLGELNWSSQL